MKSERKLKAKQLVAVNLPDGTVSILMVSACGVYSLAENGWVLQYVYCNGRRTNMIRRFSIYGDTG